MGALWIESHTVLIRHRKVINLASALRIKPAHVLGHLHALWHAALEQQEDGDLSSWSDEMIASYSGCSSDAPQYVRLLTSSGWFGYLDEGRNLIAGTEKLLHDWPDYAGKYLMGKYAKDNRDRLERIWQVHRRVYGKRSLGNPSESQVKPNHSHLVPNPPNPTNPTHPPTKANSAAADAKSELERAGVSGGKIDKIIEKVPGLSAVDVIAEWGEIQRRAKRSKIDSPAGLLVTTLLDVGFIPRTLLTPVDVTRLVSVHGRKLVSIAGVEVNGHKLTSNGQGVYADGKLIAKPEQLVPGAIEIARGK